MSEPTIPLESSLSLEDFARLVALANEGCDCTRKQREGETSGTEAHCLSCDVRRWLNEGAELVDSL